MGQFVPDLLARVALDPVVKAGGRLAPTLVFEGRDYPCKLGHEAPFSPGQEQEVALAFLSLDRPRLAPGAHFELRDPAGRGTVLRLLP